MRSLNRAARLLAAGRTIGRPALAAVPLAAALLAAALAAAPATAALAAAQSPASGGCSYQLVNGTYEWVCENIGTIGGAPGSGGAGGSKSACTLTPLSQQQAAFLGLQWPPPKGDTWEAITCPGTQPFGGVVLVGNAAGAPAVTPQQLLQIAIGELHIPALKPGTAPPVGKDGLVGLPEWFWITNWRPVSVTVTAGPVWARATAVPQQLTFNPGGGLGSVSCRGPGTAYQPKLPLSAQHTDCSYVYTQPSAGQPGNTYQASVTVSWNISWVGSGGAGGEVAAGVTATTPITLAVAAGEALVTSK
jgi:hypothetical protein